MTMTWNAEENAYRLQGLYRENSTTGNMINICSGIKDWNACDYIDYNLQEYCEFGALCWKQVERHDCCRIVEVEKAVRK